MINKQTLVPLLFLTCAMIAMSSKAGGDPHGAHALGGGVYSDREGIIQLELSETTRKKALGLKIRRTDPTRQRDRGEMFDHFTVLGDSKGVGHFAATDLTKPALLTYRYDRTLMSEIIEESLRFVYFNPETNSLDPIETFVDTENQTLIAYVSKLGAFGVDGEDSGWSGPTIGAFDVAGARGTANHIYEIPVPTGPSGLKPKLALHYASSTPNGMIGDEATDTEWVGTGWTLDIGRISGDTLTMDGVSERIIEAPNGTFYTEHQTYYKIERFDRNLPNPNPGCMSINGAYWWRVTNKQGTEFYFGTDDAGNGSTLAYMKHADGIWSWRHRVYKLYKIVDAQGNTIKIQYDNSHRAPAHCGVAPISQSYPEKISYTTNGNDTHAEYEIEFTTAYKGYTLHNQQTGPRYGDSDYKLVAIKTYYNPISGPRELIRRLDFSYTTQSANKKNILDAIQVTDVTGANTLPPTTFSYTQLPVGYHYRVRSCDYTDPCNSCNTTDHHKSWNRPFLTSVDNGYGASVDFTYSGVSRNGYHLFQTVSGKSLSDEITNQVSSFTYAATNPRWVPRTHGSNDDCNWVSEEVNYADFYGYGWMTVIDPYGNSTVTEYDRSYDGTRKRAGYLNGKQRSSSLYAAGNTNPYKTTLNTWQYAALPEWGDETAFVYLEETETFTCEGQVASTQDCVSQRTTFNYDLAKGNQVRKTEYDADGGIARVTSSEEKRHPTRYLFVQTYENIYKALPENDANLVSSIWYSYDNRPYFKAAMQSGDAGQLTAIRRWTGQGTACGSLKLVDTTFQYDSYGNRTSETTYTNKGGCYAYANANPRQTVTVYDADHGILPVSATNPLLQTTTTDYDLRFQKPVRSEDANGLVTTQDYDGFGRLVETLLPSEEANRVSQEIIYPAANQTFGAGNPYVRREKVHRGGGSFATTWRFFSGQGQLIQVHSPARASNEHLVDHMAYDLLGQKERVSVTLKRNTYAGTFETPNWNTLPFMETTYDPLGRVIAETAPNGETTETFYLLDDQGTGYLPTQQLLTATVDPKGHASHHVYDVFGNLIRIRDFTGNDAASWAFLGETVYDYDVLGQRIRTEDAAGNVSTSTFDALGQEVFVDDANRGQWSFGYDEAGNLVNQTDAVGNRIDLVYDALDRMTEKNFTNASGVGRNDDVTYSYDQGPHGIGKRTGMVDLYGSTVTWNYDARGNRIRERRVMKNQMSDLNQPGGFETRYVYDLAGNMRYMTYPDGEMVETLYNQRNQPTLCNAFKATYRTPFDGTTLPNNWGKQGDVTVGGGKLELTGNQTNYSVSAWRQVTIGDREAATFSFKLDRADALAAFFLHTGNWGQSGYRRWGLSIAGGQIRFNYYVGSSGASSVLMDLKPGVWYEANLVLGGAYDYKVEVWERDNPLTFKSVKELHGSWQGRAWTFKTQVKRGTTQMEDYQELDVDFDQSRLIQQATYDALDQPLSLKTGAVNGGLSTVYSYYDADQENKRLKNVKVTGLLDLTYSYDDAGNLTQIVDGERGQTQKYTYDALDRLRHAWTVGGSNGFNRWYAYDEIGNFEKFKGEVYSYDPDHPQAVSQAGSHTSYGYDANGSMTWRSTASNTDTFTFNGENKLAYVHRSQAGTTFTYHYDGNGQRLVRDIDGVKRLFLGNYFETDGTSVRKHYFFNGRAIAVRNDGVLSFLHNDHLGTASLTTRNGAVVHEVRHYPFGHQRMNSGSDVSDHDFTGQKREGFGMLDYGARFYDARIGRFISADSIIPNEADSQSLNRYAYVTNNPLRYSDPTGHSGWDMINYLITGASGAAQGQLGGVNVTNMVLGVVGLGMEVIHMSDKAELSRATSLVKDGAKNLGSVVDDLADSAKISGHITSAVGTVTTLFGAGTNLYNSADAAQQYFSGATTSAQAQAVVGQNGISVALAGLGASTTTVGTTTVGAVMTPALVVLGVQEVGVTYLRSNGYIDHRPTALETAGMIWSIGASYLTNPEVVENAINSQ